MEVERMIHRVEQAFWLHYNIKTDSLNQRVTVFGPTEELYALAKGLMDMGTFTGLVLKRPDGIVVQVVGSYEPRRF